MIYEFRTYQLKPGSLAEVEKRFGEGYEHRKKFSPLAAFWHTEIGPLNEIIHVWGYKDQAERTKARAEAAKPGRVAAQSYPEFIVNMKSEIVYLFPFRAELKPGKMGPVFEMRDYTVKPGTLPDIIKRWEGKIQERTKSRRWRWPGTRSTARSIATCTSRPYEKPQPPCRTPSPGEGARRRRLAAAGRRRHAARRRPTRSCCRRRSRPSSSEHGGGARRGPLRSITERPRCCGWAAHRRGIASSRSDWARLRSARPVCQPGK